MGKTPFLIHKATGQLIIPKKKVTTKIEESWSTKSTDWWWLEPWNFITFHILGSEKKTTDFHSIIFQRGWLKPPTSEPLLAISCSTNIRVVTWIVSIFREMILPRKKKNLWPGGGTMLWPGNWIPVPRPTGGRVDWLTVSPEMFFLWPVLFRPKKEYIGFVDCHFAIPGKDLVIFLQAYRYRMWSQTFLMHLDAMITDDTVLDGRSVIYTHRTNPQKASEIACCRAISGGDTRPSYSRFRWLAKAAAHFGQAGRQAGGQVARFDIHGRWWYPLINFRAIGKPRRGALAYGVSDRPSSLSLQCHCWAFWACALRTSEQAKRCQKFGLAGGFKLSIIYNPSRWLSYFIFIKMVKTTNQWLFWFVEYVCSCSPWHTPHPKKKLSGCAWPQHEQIQYDPVLNPAFVGVV